MKRKFTQLVHSDLSVALKEYEKLAQNYEDVRLEKMELLGQTMYFINYRYLIERDAD